MPACIPTSMIIAGSRRSKNRSSPPSGHGKLLWHTLGAKTIELIHERIHVEAVRDDLDILIMDADVLAELSQAGSKRLRATVR
jgi:hypothetical protein